MVPGTFTGSVSTYCAPDVSSDVITRIAVLAAWAFVGLVLTYGALYAFTPFGLLIISACLFAASALPAVGGSRWPEVLGLLAGPGLFYFALANPPL